MKTVLFDLDGTLLHMDIHEFVKTYFKALSVTFTQKGYDAGRLMKGLQAGLEAMIGNNGTVSNEAAYWRVFEKISGYTFHEVEGDFLAFYEQQFDACNAHASLNPLADEMIKLCKKKGWRVVLATNPLFPQIATQKRIRWAGCDPNDFEYITTYENSSFSKPNPAYYQEILDKLGIDVNECMMVGNDVDEDGVVEALGIPCYLTSDCLLNKHERPIKTHWYGTFEELVELFKEMQ